MNIAIFGKSISDEVCTHLPKLFSTLKENGARLLVYENFYKNICEFTTLKPEDAIFSTPSELRQNTDILLSIGGDGTLLDTIPLLQDSGIPVLGINLGRLGFLSSVSKTEIDKTLRSLFKKQFILEPRTLLKVGTDNKLFQNLNYALNELSIHRKGTPTLINIQVNVNNQFLNSYWADGLIVSTPTGSTGYSMSCNGPIVTPDSQNFIITPIASHNLTVRPIVIRDDSIVKIKVGGRDSEFLLGLDSRFVTIDSLTEIIVQKEDFCINLVQMPHKDFFSTIREKLKWGLDVRN